MRVSDISAVLLLAVALFISMTVIGQSAPTAVRKPARAPDVHYEPSAPEAVKAMLDLARVGPRDIVYDLGSGDGRIVIAAAKDYGARGVGIDIDPQRIAESNDNARRANIADRVKFIEGDLFTANFSDASVVTLFLWPSVNMKLRPKLQMLKPGTRIVSYIHDLGDWEPFRKTTVKVSSGERPIYLWVVAGPAASSAQRPAVNNENTKTN